MVLTTRQNKLTTRIRHCTKVGKDLGRVRLHLGDFAKFATQASAKGKPRGAFWVIFRLPVGPNEFSPRLWHTPPRLLSLIVALMRGDCNLSIFFNALNAGADTGFRKGGFRVTVK